MTHPIVAAEMAAWTAYVDYCTAQMQKLRRGRAECFCGDETSHALYANWREKRIAREAL